MDERTVLPPPFGWRAIPAGQVKLEGHPDWFSVPAFEMATYPITNAQYQTFLDAVDGYADVRWWDYGPKAVRWRAQYDQPYSIPYPGDDLPRVKVSWYEAVAFCRWLSARTDHTIRLPTEEEWQRAAQGDDGRLFPWGNVFEISRCNTSESGIKRPTPVTQYPEGASPFGVMDMSGNVAEWCLSAYLGPGEEDVYTFSGGEARSVRGGSWGISHHSAQVMFRGFNYPGDRFEFQGFRAVRVSG